MNQENERRSAILNCWQNFLKRPTTVLVAEVIERSKAMLPDWFAPWAPGIVVASDYLLRAAGYHLGSRRPKGWIQERPDLFTKAKYGNELRVRKCGEFWTVERQNVQMLAFPFGPVPVFTRTPQAAMRLAEYCHPFPQQGEDCFPRPREVASGLHWVGLEPWALQDY